MSRFCCTNAGSTYDLEVREREKREVEGKKGPKQKLAEHNKTS